MELSIFLSYNTQDSEKFKIKEFAQKLNSYEEIYEVSYCEDNTEDDFIAYMNECVGKCDIFLLFCSEKSIDSDFVGIEWRAALSLGKIIIPIFTNKKHIPPLLASLIGVTFNENDVESIVEESYQMILKKIKHYLRQESLTEEGESLEISDSKALMSPKKPIELKTSKEKIEEFISFRDTKISFYEADVLKELETILDKSFNLIKKVSDNTNLGFTVKNSSIKDLVIRNFNITSVPNSIGDLKSLEELYLDNNNLGNLPNTIGNLTSLKILNLGNNSIKTLPESVGNLKSLQKLYLDNNLISILPETVEHLSSLQLLTFGNKASKTLKVSHKLKKILKRLENNGVTILKKL